MLGRRLVACCTAQDSLMHRASCLLAAFYSPSKLGPCALIPAMPPRTAESPCCCPAVRLLLYLLCTYIHSTYPSLYTHTIMCQRNAIPTCRTKRDMHCCPRPHALPKGASTREGGLSSNPISGTPSQPYQQTALRQPNTRCCHCSQREDARWT